MGMEPPASKYCMACAKRLSKEKYAGTGYFCPGCDKKFFTLVGDMFQNIFERKYCEACGRPFKGRYRDLTCPLCRTNKQRKFCGVCGKVHVSDDETAHCFQQRLKNKAWGDALNLPQNFCCACGRGAAVTLKRPLCSSCRK